MTTVNIDLQEGFSDDVVEVRLDGAIILSRRGVTSDLSASLAAHVAVDVNTSPAIVEVRFPSRKLEGRFVVDVARTPHVGISIADGALSFRQQAEPFHYL